MVVTNSISLWIGIHEETNIYSKVNYLGPASFYLGIRIDRNCRACKMWLSQRYFVTELLTTYLNYLTRSCPQFPSAINFIPYLRHHLILFPTSLMTRSKFTISALYLALCTRPDIAYAAMGLVNTTPIPLVPISSQPRVYSDILSALLTLQCALEYNVSQTPIPSLTPLSCLAIVPSQMRTGLPINVTDAASLATPPPSIWHLSLGLPQNNALLCCHLPKPSICLFVTSPESYCGYDYSS